MASHYRIYLMLGVTAMLLWLNTRSPHGMDVVKVTERTSSLMQNSPHPQDSAAKKITLATLPDELNRPTLESAERDPFAVMAPPAPVVTKQGQPALPIQMVAPPPPTPPSLNLTFAGRMSAPDGSQVIYVSYGDSPLAIAVGQTLPNGYRVEAITARAVELSYPPLNSTARLDLPASPKYEIR